MSRILKFVKHFLTASIQTHWQQLNTPNSNNQAPSDISHQNSFDITKPYTPLSSWRMTSHVYSRSEGKLYKSFVCAIIRESTYKKPMNYLVMNYINTILFITKVLNIYMDLLFLNMLGLITWCINLVYDGMMVVCDPFSRGGFASAHAIMR